MKYYSDDNYIYYEKSRVPINTMGIKDIEEIEELENQLFIKSYEYFHKSLNVSTKFNEAYLKNLQKHAFSKLYKWAGKYRNKNISKRNAIFCQALYIQDKLREFFTELKKDNYLGGFHDKPKQDFAKKIAYYSCELIVIHPFFELNGRTIRLFFDMIAVFNGYDYIDYGKIDINRENLYITASKYCMSADCKPMEKLILNGLKKTK